jgi:hypothetical protein
MSSIRKVDIMDEKASELKFKEFIYWVDEDGEDRLCGDLFTVKEFLSMIASKSIMNDDGHGKLATTTQESNVYVMPSDMFHKNGALNFKFPEWATHVIWFNK